MKPKRILTVLECINPDLSLKEERWLLTLLFKKAKQLQKPLMNQENEINFFFKAVEICMTVGVRLQII